LEFIEFMMNNLNLKHQTWKLQKDMDIKLKEEEMRNTFVESQGDLQMYQSLIS